MHYWWMHDYERAAEWFKRAGEHSGRADVAGAAGRHHARRGRQPAVVAPAVDAAAATPPMSSGSRATPRIGCSSSTRWTRSTSSIAASQRLRRARAAGRRATGRNWRPTERLARHSGRSDRHAVCARSRRPGASTSAPNSGALAAARMARSRGAGIVTRCQRCSSLRGLVRRVHRQLPERRDLSAAAGAVAGVAAVAVPASAATRCGGSTTFRSSAGCCCAAVAASAASAISMSIPDRRADHGAVVRAGGVADAARAAAGQRG